MSGDNLPEYRLVRSRRKTLELRLHPDHSLEVRAPRRATQATIDAFVASRRDWIHRRRRALPQPVAPPGYTHGAGHLFEGQRLPLRIRAGTSTVHFATDHIAVQLPRPHDEHRIARALDRAWRREARQRFESLIDAHFPWFAARGHGRPQLRVKAMKTRWGSLSSRGYINLNLALIRVPPDCAEYVVVHELCHLEHAHHGPSFHRLMDQRLPDWRERKARLEAAPRQ